jgi:enamine deaminase RidA (YjgF/YER057c/UK114 family)
MSMSDGTAPAALERLGLTLPPAPQMAAPFVPVTQLGDLLHVSGQLPFDDDGTLPVQGRLAGEVDLATGERLAARCALQLLARLDGHLGSLDRVARILKLHVLVASAPEFTQQHLVANGASDLLVEVLGPTAGPHARSAFGVAALPFGSPVEIDAVVAVHGDE